MPLPTTKRRRGGHGPQLHTPPSHAKASGTFDPLCRVLCILQSLYLFAIGPMVVALVASHLSRDTPRASNCSPKQLYTWMQPDTQGWGRLLRASTSCGTVSLVGVRRIQRPVPGQPSWRATVTPPVSTAPPATHSVESSSYIGGAPPLGRSSSAPRATAISIGKPTAGIPLSARQQPCRPSPRSVSIAITQATAVACSSSTE